jgi:hypothetical protein
MMRENVSLGGRTVGFGDAPAALLDLHLPKPIEDGVIAALHVEQDPGKLRKFAATLLSRYPAAASVLQARASKLEGAPVVGVGDVGVGGFNLGHALKSIAKDAVKVGPVAFIPGAGAAVVLATGAAAAGHTKAGKKIGTDLGKNKVLSTLAQTYKSGYLQANPAFFAKTLVLGAADEALHGKNIGQAILDQRHAVTKWLGDKAKYASQAAGVPPEVTPALTAAANVAEGKPIPQDILSAAGAVVGQAVGPAATQALQQGAAYGNQLAQGVTGPVLAQVAAAKQALPPDVAHAFDTGLTLATAQKLQAKGYAAAHGLLPPAPDGSIPGKVVAALNAPTANLLSTAVKDVQRALPANAADLAHQASAALIAHPEWAHFSSTDLARQLGVPEPIARTALASVSHEVVGAPILHPKRLEAIVGRPRRPAPPGHQDPAMRWAAYYVAQGAPQAPPPEPPPAPAPAYGPYPQVTT